MPCISYAIWVVGLKSTTSTLKKWQKYVWKKVGGLRPDYTSASLETPGVHDNNQLKKAMKAEIDIEEIRKRGF